MSDLPSANVLRVRNALACLPYVQPRGNAIKLDIGISVIIAEHELDNPMLCSKRLQDAADVLAERIEKIEAAIAEGNTPLITQ